MLVSPLDLISTPAPVLNTLGLNLRVGLSSEDPMVGRNPSESYQAYLSIYSPEGLMMKREHLGEIPPNRRRFFDVSTITRELVPDLDHLAVAHRVPSRLLSRASGVEDEIEMEAVPDYSLFRSLVEYSYPRGGNGSVIYETPPRLNAGGSRRRSSNTLTFVGHIVLSEMVNTYVIIIHHSVDPLYSNIASYNFGVYSPSGELVASDSVTVGPFAVRALNMARIIPERLVRSAQDRRDGLATFTFVGSSKDAAMMVMTVNASPALGSVAVEHTHPSQTYLLPFDAGYQRRVKTDAQNVWGNILSSNRSD